MSVPHSSVYPPSSLQLAASSAVCSPSCKDFDGNKPENQRLHTFGVSPLFLKSGSVDTSDIKRLFCLRVIGLFGLFGLFDKV